MKDIKKSLRLKIVFWIVMVIVSVVLIATDKDHTMFYFPLFFIGVLNVIVDIVRLRIEKL